MINVPKYQRRKKHINFPTQQELCEAVMKKRKKEQEILQQQKDKKRMNFA